MSALDTSAGGLIAGAVNFLSSDPDVSALTSSHAAMFAALHNAVSSGPDVSHLTMSVPAMLAGIRNALSSGADISHLTTSVADMLEQIRNELSAEADISASSTGVGGLLAGIYTAAEGGGAPDTTAPTITSSNAINLAENVALSHTLTANESVTWTKTGGADTALFTLAGSNLSMTAKDFETPIDAGANNTYVVQVTATDAALNATNQTITVTVTDVVEGAAPTMNFSTPANSNYVGALAA